MEEPRLRLNAYERRLVAIALDLHCVSGTHGGTKKIYQDLFTSSFSSVMSAPTPCKIDHIILIVFKWAFLVD